MSCYASVGFHIKREKEHNLNKESGVLMPVIRQRPAKSPFCGSCRWTPESGLSFSLSPFYLLLCTCSQANFDELNFLYNSQ